MRSNKTCHAASNALLQLGGYIYLSVILFTDGRKSDNTSLLLVLYEFEARAKLGDPKLDKLLEKVLTMPNTDAKMFENLAGKTPFIFID